MSIQKNGTASSWRTSILTLNALYVSSAVPTDGHDHGDDTLGPSDRAGAGPSGAVNASESETVVSSPRPTRLPSAPRRHNQPSQSYPHRDHGKGWVHGSGLAPRVDPCFTTSPMATTSCTNP